MQMPRLARARVLLAVISLAGLAPVPAAQAQTDKDQRPLQPPAACSQGRFVQMDFRECRWDGYYWDVWYNMFVCADGRIFRYYPWNARYRSNKECDFLHEGPDVQPDGWQAAPEGLRAPSPPRDVPPVGSGSGGGTGSGSGSGATGSSPCQSQVPIDPEFAVRCVDGFRTLVRYDRVRCLDGSIRRMSGPIPVRRVQPLEPCGPNDQGETLVTVEPDGRIVPVPPPSYKYPLGGLRYNLKVPLTFPSPVPEHSAAPQSPRKTRIGLVMPDFKPVAGQTAQISGTVTTEPEKYAAVPGLKVEIVGEVELPTDDRGKPSLEGAVIDTGDGEDRPANRAFPISLSDAATVIPMVVTALRSGGQSQPLIERAVPIERAPQARSGTAPPPEEFTTSPVLPADSVMRLEGPLDGHTDTTQVLIDEKPARVVAESPEGVFVEPPPGLAAGVHRVQLRERTARGIREARFQGIVTTTMRMTAEKTSLRSGERTGFQVVVSGPEQIPASAWQDDGTVNLRIENKSPNVTMKGEQGRVIEKKLKRSDFSGGPYVYKGELQATSAGGFRINGEVNPRFRPVRAPATLVPRGDAR